MTIHCFTDGSCSNNGKKNKVQKAGYAAIFPDHMEYNVSLPLDGDVKTNNRAEMMAVIKAFEVVDMVDPTRTVEFVVHTDSMLTLNTIVKWMPKWAKKGWCKADGSPVANLDLVKQIFEVISGTTRPFKMEHVRAHSSLKDWASTWNDYADGMAKAAASS